MKYNVVIERTNNNYAARRLDAAIEANLDSLGFTSKGTGEGPS